MFSIRKSVWAFVGTAVPMNMRTRTRGKPVRASPRRPRGHPRRPPCSGSSRLPAPFVGPALPQGGDGGLSLFTDAETDAQRGPGTGSGPPACPVWSQELGTLLSPRRPHLPFSSPVIRHLSMVLRDSQPAALEEAQRAWRLSCLLGP